MKGGREEGRKEGWKEGRKEGTKVLAKRPLYFSLHLAGKDIKSTTNCNSHALLDDSYILVNKLSSSNEQMVMKIRRDFHFEGNYAS